MVSKITEGARLIEAGIKMFGHWLEKARSSELQQGIMRILVCCKEILKEKEVVCLATVQPLISVSHFQRLVYRHLYCWRL